MGANINFGSRSEFLPGERSDDTDIKYERYGGCFVSYRKGLLYLIASLLLTTIVSYLVYHYFSCKHEVHTTEEKSDNILAELLKTAEENEIEATKDKSKISTDIIPSYYNLKIQPYLDETGPKNFSFEGQVSIVFQVNSSPTKTIMLNVKDLDISQPDVSVTYITSKPEKAALVAESQVKEENATDSTTPITSSSSGDSKNKTDDTTATPMTTLSSQATETLNNVTLQPTLTSAPSTSSEVNSTISSVPSSTESIAASSTESSNTEITTTSTITSTAGEVITESAGNNIEISKQSYNKEEETYEITLKLPMEKGINYTLNMKFSGKISDDHGGILRSSYMQGNNTKWLLNTLLKPSYARTVFPCFDQPNFKTKFEIAIARRTNMSAVSNMFLKDTYAVKNSTGWVWDHFEMTPPMSTHSVAFAVFEFNSTNSPISVPYPLTKLWGRSETKDKGTYTLTVAPKLVERYNTFFGYNYSLNKVDLVAVPNLPVASFGSWGILFFRENELLVKDDSSFEKKEHLLQSLSRELAQEWFGNLISVQSWNDSWLTETISNYAHYIGMNAVEPTWDVMKQTFIYDVQDVLANDYMDLLPKITSMSANFEKDFDQQLFLAKKGSGIINMLNSTLAEPDLTAGIQNFVHKWKYKNFIQDNLWNELNSTSNLPPGIPIKDIVNLWITQKGYPLITIRSNENNSVTIKQEKFSENQKPSIDIWVLPVQYFSSSDPASKIVWLSEKSPKLIANLTDNKNTSWIFFSSQAPCRINYDLNNWQALISLLKSSPETLSPANRAQLLDDAFHLARAGLLNYSVVLDMTLYLRENEQHIIPWITTMKNFQYLNLILSKTASYGYFEDYIVKLLRPKYEKLIADTSNDYNTVKLKKIIIDWSCKLNYQPCRDWAIAQYKDFNKTEHPNAENDIPKDLRAIVYCIGVQNHGRTAWEYLWNRYERSETNPDESNALINGMSCATESWLLTKYLFRALDEKNLQNSVLMWTSMSSELAVNTAFEFLRENWSKVYAKYKGSHLAFKQILHGVLNKLTSQHDFEQVLELFTKEKSNLKDFAHDMVVIIEKLKQKISWKKEYMTTFNSWIQNNNES